MKTIRHRTDPDLVSLAALSLTAAVLTLVTAGVIQLVAAVAALTTTALGLQLARRTAALRPALVVCRPGQPLYLKPGD